MSQTVADNSIQQRLLERVAECYQIAEANLQRPLARPEVNFRLRGRAAGTAHLQQNRLRFNATLLLENSEAFMTEVVPHEICHLLAHQLYGKVKPHGAEWKNLMFRLFNLDGMATHQFNVASVTPKGVAYYCQCGEVELTIRRHNKVKRKQVNYQCRRCGDILAPCQR